MIRNLLDKFRRSFIRANVFASFILCLLICVFDLLAKYEIFSLKDDVLYLIPVVNFVKVKNYGISFGLFYDTDKFTSYAIIFVTIIIVAYLIRLIKLNNDFKKPMLYQVSILFIIGGAFGNLTDRIYNGYVRDFIDFHIGDYHWPCFNIADVFICTGVFALCICEFFLRKK